MKIEAGAQSAIRKSRLQFEHVGGCGLRGIEPPKLCVRGCQDHIRQAPIRICTEDFLCRLCRSLMFATLESAQGDGEQWGIDHRIKVPGDCESGLFRRVLILDEQTSALGVHQAMVLKYVAQARNRGLGVIFISHNIHHAYTVADRFTLLNRGRSRGTYLRSDISRDEVLHVMAGGEDLSRLEAEIGRLGEQKRANI